MILRASRILVIGDVMTDVIVRPEGRLARGLAPVSIGLVTASSYSILMANSSSALSWIVTAASLAALTFTKLNPVVLLAGGAAMFLVRALVGG